MAHQLMKTNQLVSSTHPPSEFLTFLNASMRFMFSFRWSNQNLSVKYTIGAVSRTILMDLPIQLKNVRPLTYLDKRGRNCLLCSSKI